MGRHYKQTRRARLLRLIREKIARAAPDVQLNLWHCGRSHPLAALLVDVERPGMRKLVSIVIELDTAPGQADDRKQTWVARIIETAAAARLEPRCNVHLSVDFNVIACNLEYSRSRHP